MPNGPRRQPPLVMKETEEPQASWDFGTERFALHTDAGTEDFGGEQQPMVKYAGEVQVSHGPNQDTHWYPGQEGGYVTGSHQPHLKQAAREDFEQNPGKLFGSAHEEGASTIDMIQTTEAAKVHAGGLMGLAALSTLQRNGRELTASSDRSEHSERMVNHLAANMGKQFTPREMDNLMDFLPEQPPYPREMVATEPFAGEPQPDQSLRQAQRFARRAIHKPKYGPERPASTQPQLPGMEGY